MKREILFRAKRKDNGEWVEGFYVCISGTKHYILTGNPVISPHNVDVEFYRIIPETVGQFTGLTDRNGVKIFEGDIVHAVYQSNYIGCKNIDFGIGVIKYEGSYYGGAAYGIDIIGESGLRIFTASLEHGTEVIGNIYDNPELLKGV